MGLAPAGYAVPAANVVVVLTGQPAVTVGAQVTTTIPYKPIGP